MATQHNPAQADTEPQCRICLETADPHPELGPLIRPCRCKGTIGHIHRDCLRALRHAGTRNAWYECPLCHYKYRGPYASFVPYLTIMVYLLTLFVLFRVSSTIMRRIIHLLNIPLGDDFDYVGYFTEELEPLLGLDAAHKNSSRYHHVLLTITDSLIIQNLRSFCNDLAPGFWLLVLLRALWSIWVVNAKLWWGAFRLLSQLSPQVLRARRPT